MALSAPKHLRQNKSLNDVSTVDGQDQITQWKTQLLERSADVFGGDEAKESPVDIKVLHAKIGELTLENDFLEGALSKAGLLSAKR